MATNIQPPRTVAVDEPTSQLVQVLDEYLADLQAGKRPDRERLLAEHPELSEQLDECLAGIEFLYESSQGTAAVPDRLGDFRIVREIGRGGMGVVYEAEQISLKRRVALKVLRFGGGGEEAMQRFRREAETVAELHHTNIVPIFAIGCEQDVHYYAMQFIEGRSLAQVAEDAAASGGRVPARELAGWALQASEALDHAHRRGVVHRDVKPSNLILDPAGRIWLTDFGLAKRVDDVTLSVAGALLGTPRYMSPEQASAMSRPVDHRTDIYSLGATLYELATGRPIFQADSPHAVITQILNAEPPHPRALRPDLPRDLETIILKCLAKEPEKRYSSARELADDLRAFLDERPIQARRPTWAERARRWSRRNPLAAALTGALATALVGGLIGMTSLWAVAEGRRAQAESNASTARQERETAEDRLWSSLYEQARAERLTGRRWRSLELLAEARRLKTAPQLRQEAIEAIASAGIRLVAALGPQDLIHGGETPRVAFSSDETLIATPTRAVPNEAGAEVSGIKVWDMASGQLVKQAACADRPFAFAFSPTGPLMALVGDDQVVRLWDPQSGDLLAQFAGNAPLRFSPGGTLLAVRGSEGIELRDVPNGHLVRQIPQGMPVGFASDDMLLVRAGSRIDVWDVTTGDRVSSSPEELTAVWTVEIGAVVGEGPLVALRRGARNGLQEGPVLLWNALADRTVAELPDVGRVSYSSALSVSDAAELFAFPDPQQRYAIRLFDLRLGADRRPLLSPGTSDQPLLFGRFSPDGLVFAAQEGGLNEGVRLWNTETGEPLAYLHDHENPVWSPDGRYLAVLGPGRFELPGGVTQSSNRGAVRIYEVARPVSTATVPSRPSAIAFSEDGRVLAAQGSRFEIVDSVQQPSLRPIRRDADATGRFVSTGGGLWRFRPYAQIMPSEPIRIGQVFPERKEILLEGASRAEAGSVQALAVSPDGSRALLEWERKVPLPERPGSYQIVHQLELWDLSSRSLLSVWEERPRRTTNWGVLGFSPDGRLAVTTETGYIHFRDVPSGEIVHEARLETVIEQRPDHTHTRLHSIADAVFTADGRFLVCGGDEGRMGVVDVTAGEFHAAWDAHDGKVTALAVSPDGRVIASGGEDGLLRLWDLSTGRELAQWGPHRTSVTALAFSDDGRHLASAGGDGTVRLWDLPRIRRELTKLQLDW